MARLNSFYLAPALWREPFILAGEEAHHLIRVLRAKPGQNVRLMDGRGRLGIFCIEAIGKKEVHLAKISDTHTPKLHCPLILAVGWSKNLRRGFLLEKAVELGASGIWFWAAERSQGDSPDQAKDTWERQLVAAAKQCGTAWLPEIRTLTGPEELIAQSSKYASRILCWEKNHENFLQPADITAAKGSLAVLGPEGGLSDAEAQIFQDHGFAAKNLGPHILRFETAALYILALHMWGATTLSLQQ